MHHLQACICLYINPEVQSQLSALENILLQNTWQEGLQSHPGAVEPRAKAVGPVAAAVGPLASVALFEAERWAGAAGTAAAAPGRVWLRGCAPPFATGRGPVGEAVGGPGPAAALFTAQNRAGAAHS